MGRIGIVRQSSGIYPELTVAEAVGLHAAYYPQPFDVVEIIDLVGLTGYHDERIERLSGGLQRRVDLALGMIGDPEVLFLDEPTTGFEPSARRKAWQVIGGLCSIGTTVVLTTHHMDEAQRLADRVAVINDVGTVAWYEHGPSPGPGWFRRARRACGLQRAQRRVLRSVRPGHRCQPHRRVRRPATRSYRNNIVVHAVPAAD